MGMLLKFHQLCKARREKNRFELKSIKLSNKLTRVQKNIANIQKIYSKKQTQLESMKNIWKTQLTNQLNMQAGLWGGNQGYGGMYGMSSFIMNAMGSVFTSCNGIFKSKNAQGAETSTTITQDQWNNMMTAYQNGTLNNKDANGNPLFDQTQVSIFQQAMQQSQMQQSYAQQWVQQMSQQMEMQLNAYVDQMNNQMEEEQEEALLPLNDLQNDIESDKTYVETRLTELKEEIQTLKQECSEEAKEAAPKFGLA